MNRSESIGKLAAALARAQAELRPAIKDAQNPHLKNRYADLASCWDACREVLPKNGLAVIQGGTMGEDGPMLSTMLVHESGEWVEGFTPLIYGDAKGLNPMQALGSAWSYAQRYGLRGVTGLTAEDDDGQGAGHPPKRAMPPGPGPEGDRKAEAWVAETVARINATFADRFTKEFGRLPARELFTGSTMKEVLLKSAAEAGWIESRPEGWINNHGLRALAHLLETQPQSMRAIAEDVALERAEAAFASARKPTSNAKGREPGEDG
jgi:hypothetical protein